MKTLTIALMGGLKDGANADTAFRIIEAALRKGLNVTVFGPGPAAGPLWAGLEKVAREKGAALDWIHEPAALYASVESSANTLVIPTR